MKVLIVRDREAAGGGIFNYYNAISPYLTVPHEFVGVGRSHWHYGSRELKFGSLTAVRLLFDWLTLVWKIVIFRPDLVHINAGLDPEEQCRGVRREGVALFLSRFLCVPTLVFWRGWNNEWCGAPEFPGGLENWICRTYKKAATQIVLSSRFKDDLIRWGFPMPIHVETTVASDLCLEAEVARGPGEGRINLLYLSRIEVAKGVFELLEAYRILKERNSAYMLTIAGDGPDLEALKARARALDLNEVEFPGFVSGEEKVACYRRGSIFCFPSYTEGMPNAVLEALAFGLPVAASEAGGLRDILGEGKTGVRLNLREGALKARFDPVEMADAIERLAMDPVLRKAMSQHNAAYARERFAAPKVARRLEAIYRSVLGGENWVADPIGAGDGAGKDWSLELDVETLQREGSGK